MATDIEKLRVLIPDNEQIFDGNYLFTDGDLTTYMEIGVNVYRAAGLAMIAIANSEAMISKVIKTQDLMTNGAQVADAFRRNAQIMFDRADKEDDEANGFYVDIVDGFAGPWPKPELTEWNWSTYNGTVL